MISLMLTLLKSKYPAFIWTIIIFVLCTIPGREVAKVFTWNDKISHLLAFAGFTYFWLFHTPRVFFILISGLLYGTLIELWQSVLSESFQRGSAQHRHKNKRGNTERRGKVGMPILNVGARPACKPAPATQRHLL